MDFALRFYIKSYAKIRKFSSVGAMKVFDGNYLKVAVFCKNISVFHMDPFTKCHKLVHNGGFTKIEVLYCNRNNISRSRLSKPYTAFTPKS